MQKPPHPSVVLEKYFLNNWNGASKVHIQNMDPKVLNERPEFATKMCSLNPDDYTCTYWHRLGVTEPANDSAGLFKLNMLESGRIAQFPKGTPWR
eukprot:8435777-Ditylum_brightwellii.AAC.1